MVNVPPTHFDAFLNATVKVFHDSSTFVLWDICTASTIAAFISYKFWRSLSQSLSFKNPNKWKSSCLKSGLFALHVWRVLRLMHLVSKWFEIHCSTSLDTWGAAPSCWNHWRRRSLTPVTCRSCLQKRDKIFKYWSLLLTVVGAPCASFWKVQLRATLHGFLMKLHNLLYVTIFITISTFFQTSCWNFYTTFPHELSTCQTIFFSFDQKL